MSEALDYRALVNSPEAQDSRRRNQDFDAAMRREAQGFNTSKIDTLTLNQLDQYTSITNDTDTNGLPTVVITCNNWYTIQYKDSQTGKMLYTSSINLDSRSKSVKYEGAIKGIIDSTQRNWPTTGNIFSLINKDGTREKFTIMDNASADRARGAGMRQEMNDEQSNQFSIEDIDKETLQVLWEYVNIGTTPKEIRLTIKAPFIALIRDKDGNVIGNKLEANTVITIPLNDTKSFKLSPGIPRSGGRIFVLKDSKWVEQTLDFNKPWGK